MNAFATAPFLVCYGRYVFLLIIKIFKQKILGLVFVRRVFFSIVRKRVSILFLVF